MNDLADRVQLSQSAISQHLAILRDAEIVAVRRSSQTRYYSLKSQAARTLLNTLSEIFEPQLQSCLGNRLFAENATS